MDSMDSLDSLDSISTDYQTSSKAKSNGSFSFNPLEFNPLEFDQEISQEHLPSLDSILNEKDEDTFIPEDLSSILSGSGVSDDGTSSIVSELLLPVNVDIPDMTKPRRPNMHGSVLRHVILKKISSQMVDACERREAGLPTAIAVSHLIAIGTSHGVVLVFEPIDQVLKLVLGTTSDGEKFGAVTALGINIDCSRLLVGYARGQITMWDLNNGNCIRVIADAHPAGFAVLHIQFTDDPTVAMLNDSSGSVYTLTFKRLITRTCESTCFFSGSKGEVCVMSPLYISPELKDSPIYGHSLLALASLTKLIVVSMKPKPIAVFTKKLTAPKECLPLVCWHYAVVQQANGSKDIVPVLAFGRHKTIHFFQVFRPNVDFQFNLFQTMDLKYSLISMKWLNSQVMVTIDTLERIRIFDVRSKMELECLDLGVVQLVYNSSHFKSLATGGNVSEALKAASDFACYQSVQCFNGQMLLLGTNSIHCISLRTWKDRLDYLVSRNDFIKALELAKSIYLDQAKAVIGLPMSKQKKRILVATEIINILLAHLDIAITVNCPKTHDESILTAYFRSLMPTSIEYCLLINDLDMLFTEVYDRFVDDAVARKEFLDSLEEYILDGKLKSLSPTLMQDFIEHYETSDQLRKLEAVLVHLDLAVVDINYMVKLCWNHKLYEAVIYVYNKGLRDYLTPFESLVKILRRALEESNNRLSVEDSQLGCKVLVYISCCLAGNQYPIGKIDDTLVKEVKDDIFNSLISKRSEHFPFEITYPVIRTLVNFDTREFLNVLSLAFEETEFEPTSSSVAIGAASKRQRVVDVLIQVMVNDSSFTPAQVGCLFTFIARQMAKHEGTIHVNKLLFEQVLEFLSNPDENSRHEEREQALLELLAAGGLRHFPDERILALAETAQFYRVCEIIYQKKRQFDKVLSCYWRDPARQHQAFSYIEQILADDSFTDLEQEEIGNAILLSMDHLVDIDSRKFARMIIHHFPSTLNEVAEKLGPKPEIQFMFLKGVFRTKSDEAKMQQDFMEINPEIHEKFIDLMCQYESDSVHSYLQVADDYRLEQTLAIVQNHKLIHAMSFLHEKMGDFQSAFALLCDELQKNVDALNREFLKSGDLDEDVKPLLRKTRSSVMVAMHLCLRISPRLELEDRENLWFPLLESVMAPQRHVKDTHSSHFNAYKELTKEVLSSMMAYISLPSILQKIMQDPTYSSGKFSEVKELVLGMLDTYNYEMTLLETTHKLLGRDLYLQYDQERKYLRKGYMPASRKCYLCFSSFDVNAAKDNKLALFRCGHSYHYQCLQGSVGIGEEFLCLMCNKSQSTQRGSMRRGTSISKVKVASKAPSKAKKGEAFQVDLSPQQQQAINNLWSDNSKVSKMSLLTELNGDSFDDWAKDNYIHSSGSKPYSKKSSSGGILVDEKFALRLAPPPLS